jgi:PBP1b-binding outer membrane lipoprotein LpoB
MYINQIMLKSTKMRKILSILSLGLLMGSCVSVKEYQKSRINDSEMELANRKVEKFETNFYLYREGAAGANGGKSGGGCGCN